MPERNTPEYYAMGLIDQILIEGDDSLEYQELVQKRGMTAARQRRNQLPGQHVQLQRADAVHGGSAIHDPGTTPDAIVKAWDGSIEPLRTKPVDKETLDRARVKLRSDLYDSIGASRRIRTGGPAGQLRAV